MSEENRRHPAVIFAGLIALGFGIYAYSRADEPAVVPVISQPAAAAVTAARPASTPACYSEPAGCRSVLPGAAVKPTDLRRIVDASQNNEPLFERDFKGRVFAGSMPFAKVTKDLFGGYSASFENASGTVICSIKGDVSPMANWKKGRPVDFSGTILDTFMGTLVLDVCQL